MWRKHSENIKAYVSIISADEAAINESDCTLRLFAYATITRIEMKIRYSVAWRAAAAWHVAYRRISERKRNGISVVSSISKNQA